MLPLLLPGVSSCVFYVSYVQHSNCSYFTFYTYVYYIAQLITILLSGAGDGDDNKGKYRSFVRL